MKIFVVMGADSPYSDATTWPVFAVKDEKEAKKLVRRLESARHKVDTSLPYFSPSYDSCECDAEWNDLLTWDKTDYRESYFKDTPEYQLALKLAQPLLELDPEAPNHAQSMPNRYYYFAVNLLES